MNETRQPPNLKEALAQLETCLETPIIPGEMERWTEAAEEALNSVEPLYMTAVRDEHPRKWKQIANEDPGLWRRVEQMKEEDEKGIELQKQLQENLKRLATKAELLEPDELRLEESMKNSVDDGLAFIIHVRKQEAAVDTWLIEALERDRGVVD